jgi:predicted nicotinamide N-methyase
VDGLVEERVEIGQWQLVLLRPADPAGLVDEDEFGADEFLPYWAELWPSGLALARHVGGLDLAGKTVLELGCGLGLPSLAAGLGGASVLATDWSPDALALLERNARANGAPVATQLVRWDRSDALAGRTFDFVLAADVLYEERNARPVLDVLQRVVAPGGEALVADPGRRHAAGFLAAAAARWQVDSLPEPLLPNGAVHRLCRSEPV